jgi:Tol biopolymer transport system component
MDTDGSNASQVTHGQSEESAAVSPDGKWLLYDVFSFTGSSSIWKMPLPSGTPVRMGDLKDASAPSIAPDGQSFSLSYNDDRFHPAAGVGIMRLDGTGFKPLNIPPTWKTRWNGDGSALYFVKSEQGVCNIWRQAIAGGAPVRVTNFNSGSMGWLAVSRDERLAFRHFSTIFDVVLVRSVE